MTDKIVPSKKRPHNRTHGETDGGVLSPEYRSWHSMRTRCYDLNADQYESYGGRGIQICQQWCDSLATFIDDMGRRPSLRHTLERIDNDGDYCPENCRWATKKEQARNRRSSRMITVGEKTQCAAAWAEESGIPYHTFMKRINSYGWSITKALETPVRSHKRDAPRSTDA